MKVKDVMSRQTVTINDTRIWADEFAWDGCHKLYIVTDQQARDDLEGYGYDFFPIAELKECWDASCGLRFISDASLSCNYISQAHEGPVRISI
jgi:hypothetical protein